MKTDTATTSEGEEEYVTTAQPCTACKMELTAADITKYEQFEEAYIARLGETSKEFVADLEMVYQEAGRVFTQHHVMYDLVRLKFLWLKI